MASNTASHERMTVCTNCGATLDERAQFCTACGHALPHLDAGSGSPDGAALLEADVKALQDRVYRLETRLAAAGIPEVVPVRPFRAGVTSVPAAAATGIAPAPEAPSAEVPGTLKPAAPMPSGAGTVVPEFAAASALPPVPTLADEAAALPEAEPVPLPILPGAEVRAPRQRDLESLISGRGLAFVGGLALLLGAVFFLSLAFSRGWISPGARVLIGVVAAAGMIVGGGRFFGSRQAVFGHVLTAVGLGVLSLSMIAATRLYDLIPVQAALLVVLGGAVLAAGIAIRHNLQVVAAYGIVAVLAAPPLLGAEPNGLTIAFLGATLVGTTAIALYRNWSWLPSLALVLTAPQLASWLLGDPARVGSLAALGGYWLLHVTAAGGSAFRVPVTRVRPASAATLVANAALAVWGGFEVLDGDATGWRGTFLLVLALVHGALGLWFFRNRGERDPFGMLAFGTGVGALTLAVPVQFGGEIVPMAWAAEAVAMTWVSSRFRNGFGAVAAALMGLLSIAHLALFEYPLWSLADSAPSRPFLHVEGLTLAFVLLAIVVADLLVGIVAIRRALAMVAVLLITYAMPFELSDVKLVGGWALVALLAATAERRLPHGDRERHGLRLDETVLAIIRYLAPAIPWILGSLHFILIEALDREPDGSLVDSASVAALLLIASASAVSLVSRVAHLRTAARIGAIAIATALMPVELGSAATIVAWSVLAAGTLLLRDYDAEGDRAYLMAFGTLIVSGFLLTLSRVAPVERLFVDSQSRVDHPLFWSGASAALGALALVLFWGRDRLAEVRAGRHLDLVAAVLLVYLLSVGIVDYFQAQLGEVGLESLQKRAQVALSILWALIGGAAFAWGVMRERRTARIYALVLLGMTTAKVFIYDMASLDASYRVLSLIGLGVLLMLSSYVYQRTVNSDTHHEPGTS